MRARTVQTWIARHILVRLRLENVCTSSLLFLMVATRKHSREEAARFSGLHKSPCSKMLKAHSTVAVYTLDSLSKKQAKHVAKAVRAYNHARVQDDIPANCYTVFEKNVWVNHTVAADFYFIAKLGARAYLRPVTDNRTLAYADKGSDKDILADFCICRDY